MREALIQLVSAWDPRWAVFFLSMVPITELRAAIPVGFAWGLSPLEAFVFGVAGNLIPIPFLLLLLGPVMGLLRRFSWLDHLLKGFFERGARQKENIERYGALGLTIFTAIPLPGTGVWSGSLVAYLFQISFWKSLLALALGALLAGVLVTLASMGLFKAFELIPWQLVLVILALAAAIWYRRRKKHD